MGRIGDRRSDQALKVLADETGQAKTFASSWSLAETLRFLLVVGFVEIS